MNWRPDALCAHPSDDLHESWIELVVGNPGNRVEAPCAHCVRAPYPRMCDVPFQRVDRLLGQVVDDAFAARLARSVGGERGCVIWWTSCGWTECGIAGCCVKCPGIVDTQ